MKYSEIINVKMGYNDVFDLVDEQAGDWKRFVTNGNFEKNLQKIIRAFDSPVISDHKSIWVQGTYGTGKSHSTSVVKHILSDPYEEIEDFVKNLMDQQLRSEILAYRKSKKIFPVVIKGNHNITEATDMNFVIQKEVKNAFKNKGINLNVRSDFEVALNFLQDSTFSSICDQLVNNDLSNFLSTKEELYTMLQDENQGILKIIHKKLKDYNLSLVTDNITSWLKEVRKYIKDNAIADDLVIFWDEFTSLLSISERSAIFSIVQDIAELSKTNNGIYIFLITHVNYNATDIVKDVSSDEKNKIKDRFQLIDCDIQYDTTYTILYYALDRRNPDKLNNLVDERIKRNIEVTDCLDAVVADSKDKDESKKKLYGLYPFHPYTAYISTFLARIIGSSERSVFNFINDRNNGFISFIQNEIDSKLFLNIDSLWDFFIEKFKENPKYFEVLDVYKKNMDVVKKKGDAFFSIFKAILLLNIMQSAAGTEDETDERSLTCPSIYNIERAFSGTYSKNYIIDCLNELDNNGIIQRTPDNRYEFAISAVPREKVNEKLIHLREQYSSVSDILKDFPSTSEQIKRIINDSTNLKRPSHVELFGANYKETSITSALDIIEKEHSGCVIIALFMHLGFPISESNSEFTHDELRSKLIDISNKEKYKNIVFLQINNVNFEKRRYDGVLEQLARMKIANDNGSSSEATSCREHAIKWVNEYVNQICNNGNVHLIFSGSNISCDYVDVPIKITEKILPAIYKYGLDGLKQIKNTIWKTRRSPSMPVIQKMLSLSREEIQKAGFDSLLKNEYNQYVFDENLKFIFDSGETPVSRLCSEVSKIMNEHQNDTNMDVTNYFEWMFRPPYGYIMTDSSVAAISLAFRPYINRIFISSTSSIVDALKMSTFVSDLINYYIGTEKDSTFLHIRFSSQEEKNLMDILINTFALDNKENDGLLNIKWNLREKFKKDNKAPLWVLKYVPNENNCLSTLFDDLFEFTQKQNDDIDLKIVKSLLNEITNKRLDIINALNNVKDEDCLKLYVNYIFKKDNNELNVEECIEFLRANLSGEIVFWSEREVEEFIRKFVDSKKKSFSFETVVKEPTDFSSPLNYASSNYKDKLLSKLNESYVTKEKLIDVLTMFIDRNPTFCNELIKLFDREE